jgi:hypothetical protein
MSSDGTYAPTFPPERAYFESLWQAANPNRDEIFPGQLAVPFFQKSELDIALLRQVDPTLLPLIDLCQIWSLSTVANVMKKENFFTALRFIAMAQNGDLNLTKGGRDPFSSSSSCSPVPLSKSFFPQISCSRLPECSILLQDSLGFPSPLPAPPPLPPQCQPLPPQCQPLPHQLNPMPSPQRSSRNTQTCSSLMTPPALGLLSAPSPSRSPPLPPSR